VESVTMARLIPVVVSGGSGARLWPLSTEDFPKQFHRLSSPSATLLQQTVQRLGSVQGIEVRTPILVCTEKHARLAHAQLADAGFTPSAVIAEPFGRNTAAVAMAASLAVDAIDPEALILMAPADHVISRPDVFAVRIAEVAPMARDRFVLFGIVPTSPETGYGYIETGAPIAGGLSAVARFVEKPDLETARAYLAGGRHLWNAGIFMFSPRLMIAEMERLAPEVAQATRRALAAGAQEGSTTTLDAEAFAACPSISIDCAVMEHTDKAAVVPMDAGWADIGSWSSLWEQGPRDDFGNRVSGDVEAIDTEDCLLWSESLTLATIGLKDLVVVQAGGAVIVLPRSRAQDVRQIVERLKSRGGA
jgi:mannose-1-phosphate guanylyltransferase/mannose-6-phosphate isomerase